MGTRAEIFLLGLLIIRSVPSTANEVISPQVAPIPAPLPAVPHDNQRTRDCIQPGTDGRCRPLPGRQDNRPPLNYRHPVIINQTPPEPRIDTSTLTDNWEDCRKAKLGAIRARDSGGADQADRLDEWLWKNCRSYSNELRQLEQDNM